MLYLSDLDAEQTAAADAVFEQDYTFLIGPMGCGKTVVALTAIEELLAANLIKRVLVLAPKQVADTVWVKEHTEWDHLTDLLVGVATGEYRTDVFEHVDNYQVVVTNFEHLKWMKDNDLFKHFDGLCIDESTKLKSHGTWFKSIRREIKNFKFRLVMTGTPVSENLQQLFYQMFLTDGGETLGRNHDLFLKKWFYAEDFKGYRWSPHDHTPAALTKLIAPYVYTMPDYRDNLPPLTIEHTPAPLSSEVMRIYRDMANTYEAKDVLAKTTAEKTIKLQQIASGFLYTDNGKTVIDIHNIKMQILDNLIYKIRKMGVGNILIIYTFKEELRRLREAYPDLVALGDYAAVDLVADWNAGKIELLAMHGKSGAHGLNLAAGGSRMIMLAPNWSRDIYDQCMARLWRRGQKMPVVVHVISAEKTIDTEVILPRLAGKGEIMPLFIQHLKDIAAQDGADKV